MASPQAKAKSIMKLLFFTICHFPHPLMAPPRTNIPFGNPSGELGRRKKGESQIHSAKRANEALPFPSERGADF